jgi:hypothetical protein
VVDDQGFLIERRAQRYEFIHRDHQLAAPHRHVVAGHFGKIRQLVDHLGPMPVAQRRLEDRFEDLFDGVGPTAEAPHFAVDPALQDAGSGVAREAPNLPIADVPEKTCPHARVAAPGGGRDLVRLAREVQIQQLRKGSVAALRFRD